MIGKTVLHYKILEKLGEGGMGVVYLAEDTKLERQVAIKFLPSHIAKNSEERKRFEVEAKAAAALNHSSIATIHAIEETHEEIFLVMEYIDGQELKSIVSSNASNPLPFDTIINYAIQIAEGLQTAHSKDVIHRDIKASNIMITNKNKVKIMDFGLAKYRGRGEITKVGTTIGTVAYMSPEQAHGDEVDQRADIWSFGVVLYEMLCGQLPYKGSYEQAIIYAILNESPKSVLDLRTDTPSALISIIEKSMEREIDNRYASFADILADLNELNDQSKSGKIELSDSTTSRKNEKSKPARLIAPLLAASLIIVFLLIYILFIKSPGEEQNPVTQIKKVAVLPFKSLRSDPETDFLGFSLADQIITKLNYIKIFSVRPSDAIRQYENSALSLSDIAEELDVELILTGSYLRQEAQFRLNAQLVNITSNEVLWSEPVDVQYENIFTLQDTISKKVVDGMKLQLSDEEDQRLKSDVPSDPLAYEYFLRAKANPGLTRQDQQLRIDLLSKSLELDSTFAPAWAFLGFTYKMYGEYSGNREQYHQRAIRALNHARQLNHDLVEAATQLAIVYTDMGRTEEAAELMLRSLEVSPNNTDVYSGLGYMYRYAGLLPQSVAVYEKHLQYHKKKRTTFGSNGQILKSKFYEGKYAEVVQTAEQLYKEIRDSGGEPSPSALFYLGFWNYNQGNKDKAYLFFESIIKRDPTNIWSLFSKTYKLIFEGNYGVAAKIVDTLEKRQIIDSEMSYRFIHFYSLMGDRENAIRSLKRSVDGGFFCYPYISQDPLIENIRNTKEYKEILVAVKERHMVFKEKYGNLLF
jgi:serine/threonine protein kinase/Tfp pilus assembly protein PilF